MFNTAILMGMMMFSFNLSDARDAVDTIAPLMGVTPNVVGITVHGRCSETENLGNGFSYTIPIDPPHMMLIGIIKPDIDSKAELYYVIGHEIAHMQSAKHKLYGNYAFKEAWCDYQAYRIWDKLGFQQRFMHTWDASIHLNSLDRNKRRKYLVEFIVNKIQDYPQFEVKQP